MSKEIIYNIDARDGLKRGVDKLANAVKVTLGARGRNVVIEKPFGSPLVTKDGVTVAKYIELSDKIENMGAQMLKEVASKTNDNAGDGTSSSVVLAQAIVSEGLKNVTAGANPIDIQRGINKAVDAIVEGLKEQAQVITNQKEIAQIGTISANNDSFIGELIAEAMERVGKNGVITVNEANGMETRLETVEGMQLNKGYLSPYFVTNQEKSVVELKDAYVLVVDKKLNNGKELRPLLEKVQKAKKPLLVIAEDVEGEVLSTLIVNKLHGVLDVVAIKAPSFGDVRGDQLQDIAVVTGAKLLSEKVGDKLETATLNDLGTATNITVTKTTTTIVGGGGQDEEIESRVKHIQRQIEKTTSDFDREKMQERLGKITGGVAVIHVGGTSEVEMKERKDRVDDALHATRAAVEEGIVVGGGVALLRASKKIDGITADNSDEQVGFNIVRLAIESPLRTIANNAGVEGSVVVQKVMELTGTFGYNARTEVYEDLMKSGVIDPVKVTRTALENAASVAGLLLTTEAIILTQQETKE